MPRRSASEACGFSLDSGCSRLSGRSGVQKDAFHLDQSHHRDHGSQNLSGLTEHMTFVLTAWFDSTPGYLQEVTVSRCVDRGSAFPESGEVMWSAFLTTGAEAPLVGRFGYGQNLSGLTTSHEPAPLGPGCYIVRAYARFPDTRQAVLVVRVRLRQTSPATTIRPWSEASAAAQDDSPCAVGCVPR